MGLEVTNDTQGLLIQYVLLLEKWTKAYNLTSIRDPSQMVLRHLLDSLSVVPYLTGQRIIDVGTGAGLPGIPLALIFPDREFVLLDSNNKKTRFVTQVMIELNLENVTVINERVENYRPEVLFDVVISRAFSSIAGMVKATAALCQPDGCLLAMKGKYPADELSDIPSVYEYEVIPLNVPGLDAERHLVILKRR